MVVGATIVVMRGVVGVNWGAASTVHPGAPVTLGLHSASGEPTSDTKTEMYAAFASTAKVSEIEATPEAVPCCVT